MFTKRELKRDLIQTEEWFLGAECLTSMHSDDMHGRALGTDAALVTHDASSGEQDTGSGILGFLRGKFKT